MKQRLLLLSVTLILGALSAMAQGIVIDKNNLSKKMLTPHAEQIEQLIHKNGLRSQTAATLTDLGNNMYLLDGTTDPSSSLLEMKVSATQWAKLTSGNDYYGELQNLSKLVYTKFNDDFDYIFFVLDIPQDNTIINQVGFYGVNCSVSNDVQGIGISTYNNGSYWGANSKLKSVMYLPYYSAILNGPALHELCHNWAVFICPTYAPDNTEYYAHWGVANAGGQLGGFRYVRTVEQNSGGVQGKTLYQASFDSNETNADGSFKYPGFGVNANGGNGLPFSDIELYLMGMKSAQELRNTNFHLDIYSGNDYEASGDRSFGNGYFYSTTKTTYTIDDIITLRGARIPDAASSQKQFKLLTVSITPESAATTYYDQIINNVGWMAGPFNDQTYSGWLYNFRQATNNVGSLVMDNIKASLKSTSQLSNDATLASLTVSTGTLSPAFVPNTTNYSVNVANNVSNITISAAANHSAATVNGAGTKTLNVGANNFNIVVTAEDGTEKTYTVVVTRATGTVTGPCENPTASGTTGDLTWTLCPDGTLTISGTGVMPDYQGLTAPWYEDRENIQKIIIEDGVTSIGYDAFFGSINLSSVTIPNSVVSIGMEAFQNCSNLLSVTIPNSVTSIVNYAFAYCRGLTSITIPNSVTNIGCGAFEGCNSLTTINVDNANNNYDSEDGILYNKAKTILHTYPSGKNTSAFVIPNSVTSIALYAFGDCTNLTSVTIPNSVTSIEGGAFQSCYNLNAITIPYSVTNIGIAAFQGCSSLSSFAVEETNTYYSSENGILYNKDKTMLHSYVGGNGSTAFEIPNTVTSIESWAFSNFGRGTSILIPNSVTSIGFYAFANCGSLTDVTVMWNTPLVVSNLFGSGLTLTSVTLHVPAGTKSLYEAADVWKDFGTIIELAPAGPCENPTASGTTGSLSWTLCSDGTLTISGEGAMPNYSDNNLAPWYDYRNVITSVVVKEGVTSIGSYAFQGNSYSLLATIDLPQSLERIEFYALGYLGLTSLTIPKNVNYIGYYALTNLYNLSAFKVEAENAYFIIIDGVLFDKTANTLIQYPGGKTNVNYSVPDGTNIIKDFGGNKNVRSIHFPESVTTFEPYSLSALSNLETVNIPDNVTVISMSLFRYDDKLQSVNLPNNITTIDFEAFTDCKSLVSIIIPEKVTNIGYRAFSGCQSLTDINVDTNNLSYISINGILYNKDQTILVAYPAGKSGTFDIPNGVITIKPSAFSGCAGLTSITIPESVTTIGENTTYGGDIFWGCTSLISVTNLNPTPQNITNSMVYGFNLSAATLFVPYGSKAAYEAADVWKDFGTIIELAPDTIAVTGISLSTQTLELKVDSTAQLTAAISPEDATNQIYTWETSNAAIATVSETGLVKAIAAGSTYVFATIIDGKNVFADSCLVTVTANPIRVTGVSLSQTSLSLEIDAAEQLTATVLPENATNKNLTWSSSNETVATVSATGLITAKAEGTATITVSTEDGGFTASCTVTVTRPLSNDATLSNLAVNTGTLTPGFNPDITDYSVSVENSMSSIEITATANHAAATVSGEGTKTLNTGANSFDITVTAEDGTTKTYTVTVNRAQAIPVPVTGISLNQTTLTLKADSTAQLTATVTPDNADNKAVAWSSSDNSIATVSNGLVTGISEGTATITATTEDGGFTTSCTVTVEKNQTVVIEEDEPAGANGTGKFDLSLTIPANTLFTGSFTLTLPNGFQLDVQATKLSGELSSSLTLSLTQNADGSWQFTISGNALRNSTESVFQKIVDIVYTIDESLENGQYEVAISDLSFTFEDGTHIDEPEIIANVTVDHSYTGIQSPNPSTLIVQIRNNYLYVNTSVEEYIQIYSVTGQLLYSRMKPAGEITVALPSAKGQMLIIKGSSGWVKKVM